MEDSSLHQVAGILTLGILLPAWLVLGYLDWRHHRRTNIEYTSGWRESGLHLFMVGQAGFAVLAGLFLEVNALILALIMVAYVAHEITTGIDVGYAAPKRAVLAKEQRVHDFMTAIPMTLVVVVIITHGGQFATLFGLGQETADFSLRWREDPLPTWYLAIWLLVSPINALLYLEEFVRCIRAQRPAPAAQRKPTYSGS